MTGRCLSLRAIVTIRFWQFGNGHKNPSCGFITFRMRDLNVMTHEMFGNRGEFRSARCA
jgi:hypothetical protein